MPNRTTPEHRWAIAAIVIASVDAIATLAGHGDHVLSLPLKIAAGIAAVGWMIRAAEARLDEALDRAVAARRSLRPARRSTSGQNGDLLTLVDPEIAEAAERRRLAEVHLRDQLAGELGAVRKKAYAKGYVDGVLKRLSERRGE